MERTFRDLTEVIGYVKDQVDLVAVMGQVVKLEKAGPDLHKAVCCFHQEKTPSLTVTPSKGLYHCFGCHAGGDAITFVKEMYNISTTEAVYQLAAQFDLDLTP